MAGWEEITRYFYAVNIFNGTRCYYVFKLLFYISTNIHRALLVFWNTSAISNSLVLGCLFLLWFFQHQSHLVVLRKYFMAHVIKLDLFFGNFCFFLHHLNVNSISVVSKAAAGSTGSGVKNCKEFRREKREFHQLKLNLTDNC